MELGMHERLFIFHTLALFELFIVNVFTIMSFKCFSKVWIFEGGKQRDWVFPGFPVRLVVVFLLKIPRKLRPPSLPPCGWQLGSDARLGEVKVGSGPLVFQGQGDHW